MNLFTYLNTEQNKPEINAWLEPWLVTGQLFTAFSILYHKLAGPCGITTQFEFLSRLTGKTEGEES